MQFSESWLRSFVNPDIDSATLCHTLTMAGLEVEDAQPVVPPIKGVVAGKVLSVVQHPNADRLKVCLVDIGIGAPLNIVCGAPNVAAGMIVPCATIGAVLAPASEGDKPFEIKLGKLRGVESQGMLCSARELKLSEDHSGLMALPADTTIGQNINDVLDLNDTLITIKLTPNKADCLSVYGVARELHALTGAPLNKAAVSAATVNDDSQVAVNIAASDLCGRFSGRVLKNLNTQAATPDWMVQRLARSGQRSISALVDISNYVMLELGRPTHIFDLAKLSGGLTVRWAKTGETLKLLNGNTINLHEKLGVIADDLQVESLAGIMGGDYTAVSDTTTDIYVEAAFWWPAAIQGRSRQLNFSTDAAHRFERGVDFADTVIDIEYITTLILQVCGKVDSKVGPINDIVSQLPARLPVKMRVARAQKIIGVQIAADEMKQIFNRLSLSFKFDETTQVFTVTPPSFRFDIEIEEDLIEEIARIYGFERIPSAPPQTKARLLPLNESKLSLHALRQKVAERDYQEVINYSFVDAAWERDFTTNVNPINLLNPISSNMSVMRSSIIGNLVANLKHNLSHKVDRVRVFEIGKIFLRDDSIVDGNLTVAGVNQHLHLCGLAYGAAVPEQWGTPAKAVDFYDVKADVEALLYPLPVTFERTTHPAMHPGRCAKVVLNGRTIAFVGELHPKWQQKYELPNAPILFECDVEPMQQRQLPSHADISKFPAVTRDLALIVGNEVTHDQVIAVLKSVSSPITQQINLFDQFRGGNITVDKKSLAFRVVMRETERTLTDLETDQEMDNLRQAAIKHLNASLR